MTKTPADALLPVTWEDRDAAREALSRIRGYGVTLPNDGHHLIQAFARHRFLSPPPGEDQAAEGVILALEKRAREICGDRGFHTRMKVDGLAAYAAVCDALKLAHPATPEKAAERGDLWEALQTIANWNGTTDSWYRTVKRFQQVAADALVQAAALSSGGIVYHPLNTSDVVSHEPPSDDTQAAIAQGFWLDLCEKDDRTSPEEYPDMCLITEAELADMLRYVAALSTAPAPSLGEK